MLQNEDPLDAILTVQTVLRDSDVTYAALYSPFGEFMIYAAPIGLILAAIVIAMVNWAPHGDADKAMAAFGGIVVVISWAKVLFVVIVLVYPGTESGRPPIKQPSHIICFRKTASSSFAAPESVFRWTDITRAIETPKGFLFYQAKKIAAFLPRRCLQGNAEIAIIRKFIGTYVANAKLLT